MASPIGLTPLFGPFSAEAFASAAAFQPVLELVGPFLVEFAKEYAVAEPSLTPLVDQFERLENEGFSVLPPLYAATGFWAPRPHRPPALAPDAQLLASNPLSSCLVDIEAVLASDTGS